MEKMSTNVFLNVVMRVPADHLGHIFFCSWKFRVKEILSLKFLCNNVFFNNKNQWCPWIWSNGWPVIPHSLAIGTHCTVRGHALNTGPTPPLPLVDLALLGYKRLVGGPAISFGRRPFFNGHLNGRHNAIVHDESPSLETKYDSV